MILDHRKAVWAEDQGIKAKGQAVVQHADRVWTDTEHRAQLRSAVSVQATDQMKHGMTVVAH